MIATDGTVVDDDVPCPKRDGIPLRVLLDTSSKDVHPASVLTYLFNLKLLLSLSNITACSSFCALDLRCGTGVSHLDVGHRICGVSRVLVVLWYSTSGKIGDGVDEEATTSNAGGAEGWRVRGLVEM